MHYPPALIEILKGVAVALGAAILVKAFDWLLTLSKTQADRLTAREQLVANVSKEAMDRLETDLKRERDQREKLSRTLDEMQTQVSVYQNALRETQESIRTYQVAVDGLSEKLDEQAKEIADLKAKLRVVTESATHWKRLAESRKTDNDKLQRRVLELEAQVAALQGEVEALQTLTKPFDLLNHLNAESGVQVETGPSTPVPPQ